MHAGAAVMRASHGGAYPSTRTSTSTRKPCCVGHAARAITGWTSIVVTDGNNVAIRVAATIIPTRIGVAEATAVSTQSSPLK